MTPRTRALSGLAGVAALVLAATPAAVALEGASTASPAAGSGATRHIVMLDAGADAWQPGANRAAARSEVRAATAAAVAQARGRGLQVERTFPALGGYVATMTPAQARSLATDPTVSSVEADGVVTVSEVQSGATWGLDRVDQRTRTLNGTYSYTATGAGVDAYIIDTGIRSTHAEFAGRMRPGANFVSRGKSTTEDCNGHGTHVAGTVGGTTYGVAKGVNLVPVRVLDCRGSGSWSGVVAGMDWVAQKAQGPSVANMSLGGGASTSIDQAVVRMTNAKVTTVVAAGNEDQNACNVSPARAGSALTVGATDRNDTRASFSNFGTCVDIFAPGVGITSAWYQSNTQTSTISGTSMAAPHVAGAAALVLQGSPTLSPAGVESALESRATANVVGDPMGSPNLLLYTGP
ncbi:MULTISPECIES: S8 family peptidase [unclassified Ornithinimicrobium]|uniref:S8 family peptidase n=1 Tax=unclassified Ornithinimicrobium TaxID=2615080 RepID=UPI0038540EFE